MKILIDYNRTLYNPETNTLYEGVQETLKALSKDNELILISRNEPNRERRLQELGIEEYFTKIAFVAEKNSTLFNELLVGEKKALVIGDRIREEISIGNELGLITIWVRQGKFNGETPRYQEEEPAFVVGDMREVSDLILNI
jgi:FMN phosphatase YigB (HAD superfamily)